MRVLSANDGLLTAVEVYDVLCNGRPVHALRDEFDQQLAGYIAAATAAPAAPADGGGGGGTDSATRRTRASLDAYLSALSAYDLRRSELVQMADLAPCLDVHVHLLIEECAERLSPAQIAEVAALSETLVLPADTAVGVAAPASPSASAAPLQTDTTKQSAPQRRQQQQQQQQQQQGSPRQAARGRGRGGRSRPSKPH